MFIQPEAQLSAVTVSIPDGVAGIQQTVRLMRASVRKYRADPNIRARALSLVQLIPQLDTYAEMRALFEFVRDRIRYTGDVLDVETLTTPDRTLSTGAGDCDDKAVLLASLLESIGIPTRFVTTGYSLPGVFEHVYVEAMLSNGAFISLDCSDANFSFGWEAPAPIAYWAESV